MTSTVHSNVTVDYYRQSRRQRSQCRGLHVSAGKEGRQQSEWKVGMWRDIVHDGMATGPTDWQNRASIWPWSLQQTGTEIDWHTNTDRHTNRWRGRHWEIAR